MLARKATLQAKLLICKEAVQDLLRQIDVIEADTQASNEIKLTQTKKIREEMNKIGEEVDMIRKSIMLLDTYSVN
jgi:hypothetical protein